ncbi:MAG: RHS repeat-associated core domain-containing protein [Planctomycetes bacterium]|nr:RHS repeat-associated core domain-containing protein [Planctomycetota bacterium]
MNCHGGSGSPHATAEVTVFNDNLPFWTAQVSEPNLLSVVQPNALALEDEGSVQFTSRIDPAQDQTRDHVVVDPSSGTLTFNLPLPYSIKGRADDLNPALIFRSNANRPKSHFGHFWSASWDKVLTVEFSDNAPNQCGSTPSSATYLSWLRSIQGIMEHDSSGGAVVWTNRDAIQARNAFAGRHAVGLPSANLSGFGEFFPIGGSQTQYVRGPTTCPDMTEPDEAVRALAQSHRVVVGPNPHPIGFVALAEAANAEPQTYGPMEFVPPLGVYDEMHFDCQYTRIRHPDGSIDVFSRFAPISEHAFEKGHNHTADPNEPPPDPNHPDPPTFALRSRAIAALLRTEYPNGDKIEYRYDTYGRLDRIIDNYGRVALTFAYPTTVSNRIVSMHDFLGRTTTFGYGASGLLESVTTPKAVTAESPALQTWRFEYTTRVIPAPYTDVRQEFARNGIVGLEHFSLFAPNNPADLPVVDADFYVDNITVPQAGYWDYTKVSDLRLGAPNQNLGLDADGNVTEAANPSFSLGGSGKWTHYDYTQSGCFDNYTVTITDSLGLTRVHEFDWQSRELSRKDHLPGMATGDYLTTRFEYADQFHPKVIRTIRPKGNVEEERFQFQADDEVGKTYYEFLDVGEPASARRDRFQGANLLQKKKVHDPNDPTQPPDIVETWAYEPLCNQVRVHTDANGHVTTTTFDYQEAATNVDFDPVAAEWSLTPIARGLGDVNGDGSTIRAQGNSIRIDYPTINLAGSLTQTIQGGPQVAFECLSYNLQGQIVWKRDAAGKYTSYEYYASSDPDGDLANDGISVEIPPPPGETAGFLHKVIVDSDPSNPVSTGYMRLTTETGYDPYGKVIWQKDPRGNYHVRHYNEINLLDWEVAGDVDSAGIKRTPTSAYTKTKYTYDLNDNKKAIVEDNDDAATNTPAMSPGHPTVTTRIFYDVSDYPRVVQSEYVNPATPTTPSVWRTAFYHYDGNGKCTKEVSPKGRAKYYFYDALGRAMEKRVHLAADPNPGSATIPTLSDTDDDPRTKFGYDSNGNLVSGEVLGKDPATSAPRSYISTIEYDWFDRRTALNGPLIGSNKRLRTEYVYDPKSNVTKVTKRGPRFEADTAQEVLSETMYIYDDRDRCYRSDASYFQWQQSGTTWTKVDLSLSGHNGATRQEVAYDPRSLVVAEEDDIGVGHRTTIGFDAAGRESSRTLPKVSGFTHANWKERTYDENGNLKQEKLHEYGKDATGVEIATPEDFVTTWDYDALNRKTKETREPGAPESIQTTFEYSSLGNLTGTWNPNNVGTRTFFDSMNRPVVVRTGYVTPFVDASGNPATAGNVPGINNSDAFITVKTSYDEDGLVTVQTDDRSKYSTTDYDWAGRKTRFTYMDLSREDLHYLKEGPLAYEERFDAANIRLFKVDYGYDPALRKTSSVFTLDAISNLSGVRDEAFVYDGLGRVLSETATSFVPSHSNWLLRSTVTKSYDSLGAVRVDGQNLTQLTAASPSPPNLPDGPGHTETTLFADTVTTTFDTLGNQTAVQAGNGYSITNEYDELNRLKNVYKSGVIQHTFDYLGSGHRLRRQANANATVMDVGVNGYDKLRRVKDITHKKSGIQFAGFTYSYDPVGNELEERKKLNPPNSKKFTYDGANRLRTYTVGDPNSWPSPIEQFDLDGVGNWGGHTLGTTSYSNPTNPVHEYTAFDNSTTLTYDGRGNVTSFNGTTFVYDARGRIVAATPSGQSQQLYAFDADGRRVLAEGYYFSHSGLREIRQVKGTSPFTEYQFTYGSGLDEVLSFTKDSVPYTLVVNRNGSTTGLTNLSGTLIEAYDYSPYGQVTVTLGPSTPTCPYLFVGRRRDSKTGLYFMRARYYSATMGRFMSRDPIGVWGDASNLGNAYNYGANNPHTYTDPMGTELQVSTKEQTTLRTYYGSDNVSFKSVGGGQYHVDVSDAGFAHMAEYVKATGGSVDFATSVNLAIANPFYRYTSLTAVARGNGEWIGKQFEGMRLPGMASGFVISSPGYSTGDMGTVFGNVPIIQSELTTAATLDWAFRSYFTPGNLLLAAAMITPWPGDEEIAASMEVGLSGSAMDAAHNAATFSRFTTHLAKAEASAAQMEEVMSGGGAAFAGAGTAKPLNDIQRLMSEYGGSATDWVKIRSSNYVAPDGVSFEVHAYQNIRTTQVVEYKTKFQ